MSSDTNITEQKIITLLAEHIGTDEEELSKDDAFQEGLQMSPSDIADFIEKLNQAGLDTSEVDLTQITTVDDLVDKVVSQEEFK
jgi:acyl carrier protein